MVLLFLFCLNCNDCWSITIRGRCIEAKCGVSVFRYWVLFLVCTAGVTLMLPEVKVIKEVSNCQRAGGFDPEGQKGFDRLWRIGARKLIVDCVYMYTDMIYR